MAKTPIDVTDSAFWKLLEGRVLPPHPPVIARAISRHARFIRHAFRFVLHTPTMPHRRMPHRRTRRGFHTDSLRTTTWCPVSNVPLNMRHEAFGNGYHGQVECRWISVTGGYRVLGAMCYDQVTWYKGRSGGM